MVRLLTEDGRHQRMGAIAGGSADRLSADAVISHRSPFRADDTRNIAINALKSSRLLAGVGQTFSLAAHVQNYSTVETSGFRMRWIVAGREETQTEIPSLPPGDTHEATWRHAFTRPGVFSVSCEIIDDGGGLWTVSLRQSSDRRG